MADNLEKGGLIQRERGTGDRRVVVVTLTAKGRALTEAVVPGHVAAIVQEMGAITPEE